ncbi:hypothetical protein MtrunA17_Chr5g0422951 [Medicago truncatula]|uniref:Homologous-pairing protein 2 winged helix domain-containing protein n=1 Tax=Medicago truncatula TaxID=3880 RepID=A0A072UQ55_MEDTR|nr:golgin candidate 4 isoform X2 [Medicago truncatula]KEH27975.1 hypothetical protein MTR_5g055130 [Medicago truncatula]RHN55853.1 hypothetical protein MtrunA17_Chr5g0422951 [Medicago truncatula]
MAPFLRFFVSPFRPPKPKSDNAEAIAMNFVNEQNRPLNALQKFKPKPKKTAIQKALNCLEKEELNQMKKMNADLQKQFEEQKKVICEVEAGHMLKIPVIVETGVCISRQTQNSKMRDKPTQSALSAVQNSHWSEKPASSSSRSHHESSGKSSCSSDWSFNLEKYRSEAQRLRERVRELADAEENVSLQREISSFSERETESKSVMTHTDQQHKVLTSKAEKMKGEILGLPQNLSELQDRWKIAEVTRHCLRRNFEENVNDINKKQMHLMRLNKIESALRRELESHKFEEILGLRQRLHERVRELADAEQNVSLQREISSFKQNLSELQDRCKIAEVTRDCLRRNFEEDEKEIQIQRLEKEKNEMQSALEKELDRRSSDWWSIKLEKYQSEEQRLRKRIRELAEQNASLQREIENRGSWFAARPLRTTRQMQDS